MTIALSANTSWNIVNFRLGLMKELRSRGYVVIAIAPHDDFTNIILNEGFEFIPLKYLDRKGSNPLYDMRLMNEYKKNYLDFAIDVILLYTIKPVIYGNLAARNTKVFSIATITGLGYTFLNKGIRPFVAKRLYKIALKHCDKIFFQNSDDLLLFEDSGIINKGIAKIINGSGIDTETVKPIKNKKIDAKKEVAFIYIGRMLVDKGIRELLIAFRKLAALNSNVSLTMVGSLDKDNPSKIDNDEFEILCGIAEITYLGHRNDILDLIQECDVVVLPSYREGIPKVLLEAMSLAKPIITTNAPGCRHVVVNGVNGLMCEVKSTESLYFAMEQLLQMPEDDRLSMGLRGRKMAKEKYDQKIISQVYIDIFRNLQVWLLIMQGLTI